MKKTEFLNDLCDRLSSALPSQLKHVKDDVEKNFQAVLKKAFEKLELVTREEFETQTKVLARTRRNLEALEKEVRELEEVLRQK